MERTRAVTTAVTAAILGVTLLSGPLVPGVTVAQEPDPLTLETGNSTVADAQLPDRATLERGSYGAANYYIRVPPATVRFATLEGNPTLVYELKISELGYTRTTNHFLNASSGNPYELTLRSDTFDESEITNETYGGSLTVIKRDDSGHNVIESQNITVEVTA